MFEQGYFVTAELKVKDENRTEEAKHALQNLCNKTLQEPGCSLFTLHQCANDPSRFILWERFDDEDAFRRHFLEAHTLDYLNLDLTEVIQYFKTDVVG